MKNLYKICILLGVILVILNCRKPFQPAVTTINSNILVVEGLINTGADSTIIHLSRTVVIADKNSSKAETGAVVTVESDANDSYALAEKTGGNYISTGLNISNAKKYRLRIRTAKGSTYLSDFVESKVSPPIDSINWVAGSNGLQLYSNTHDPSNNTRYYRYEYTETWRFFAKYYSAYIFNGKSVVERDQTNDNISSCFAGSKSTNVILASSAKLDKDVIYLNPLTLIPPSSEKVSSKYSTLVKQYALTKDAFDFWTNLKKNTESLGSIFDAQPSQLTGNVHNVADPSEPVIGYISAGTVQQKRIFVSRTQLPDDWRVKYPYSCSEPDSIPFSKESVAFANSASIPLMIYYNPEGTIALGHTASGRACADCTIRGVNKQPAFWQ